MPNSESIQSVQRAIAILYSISGVEDGCSIHQIAGKTGLKPNTVYKFTRTLEAEHFLERKTQPLRFVLGPAIRELKRLDDERHLLSISTRILARTHVRLLNASFMLLELDGAITHQRLCTHPSRPGIVISRREYIVPLYEKASSLLFLAYADVEQTHKFYQAHPFEIKGKPHWGSQARLDEFLQETRHLGYCQPSIPDPDGPHYRVAAPVFSPSNELIATVGGCLMSSEPPKDRPILIRLCVEAANEITHQLRQNSSALIP